MKKLETNFVPQLQKRYFKIFIPILLELLLIIFMFNQPKQENQENNLNGYSYLANPAAVYFKGECS